MGIWTIHLEANASFTLPKISPTLNRHLYLYNGGNIIIDNTLIKNESSIKLVGDQDIKVTAGDDNCYLLLLEGEPIGEPVVNIGPFVMNTEEEIKQAYDDYRSTRFGGWPFNEGDPVNAKTVVDLQNIMIDILKKDKWYW